MAAFEERSRVEFEQLVELELSRVPPDDRVIRRGRADEEIAEEVAAWHADLLVVGSHGKGWIDRLLIGSTTERLLNRLPTSLLVVPIGRPAVKRPAQAKPRARARRRKGTVIYEVADIMGLTSKRWTSIDCGRRDRRRWLTCTCRHCRSDAHGKIGVCPRPTSLRLSRPRSRSPASGCSTKRRCAS
jgi:hypothetical protein